MKRLMWNSFVIAATAFAILSFAQTDHAAEDSQATWSPKFYGFCIDTHDAKKRTLPQQADMLRELGFDGVGYAEAVELR